MHQPIAKEKKIQNNERSSAIEPQPKYIQITAECNSMVLIIIPQQMYDIPYSKN